MSSKKSLRAELIEARNKGLIASVVTNTTNNQIRVRFSRTQDYYEKQIKIIKYIKATYPEVKDVTLLDLFMYIFYD